MVRDFAGHCLGVAGAVDVQYVHAVLPSCVHSMFGEKAIALEAVDLGKRGISHFGAHRPSPKRSAKAVNWSHCSSVSPVGAPTTMRVTPCSARLSTCSADISNDPVRV